MKRAITYSFGENFLSELAKYIVDNFLKQRRDLSKLALVFGGKRPALFLKQELARRLKGSFIPPSFFSMDEFMGYLLKKKVSFRSISDLEACYIIYQLAKKIAPQILRERKRFSEFLPWARELHLFLEELDLEAVEGKKLKEVEQSAEIGYEIPESINLLLRNIIKIKEAYLKILLERNTYSRGLIYFRAANAIREVEFPEFEKILFCNFYYLHRTEERVIQHLYQLGKAILFFQKDEKDWPLLDKIARRLSIALEPVSSPKPPPNIFIWKGFDTHSQVGISREILKGIEKMDHTLIVLPEPATLIALLPEVSSLVEEFNVSMGYPLKRSSLYGVFSFIVKAQTTKKGSAYYSRDYLKVLTHPLIKNLSLHSEPGITRVLVHKIEEILLGIQESILAGSLFVRLDDLERLNQLYGTAISTLNQMGILITPQKLENILQELHRLAFRLWEEVESFAQLAESLEEFLQTLLRGSLIATHPLNLKVLEKLLALKDELKAVEFSQQKFSENEIYKIFMDKLENERISFSGSPLKGLQILGLLETRALSFENVIVLDANESILPKLRRYEPLIPREVLLNLGLDRIEKEEEIQRYHFMRLLGSARNVHLIFDDSPEKVKSRFIEEIIWEKEKQEGRLNLIVQKRASFKVEVMPKKGKVRKRPEILEVLADFTYSPSSIDTYLQCPMQFYYRYLLALSPKENLLSELEGIEIGNFVHKLLEEAFIEFVGKKPRIDKRFEEKFLRLFRKSFDERFNRRIGPEAFMVRQIMEYRLRKFLEKEKERQAEVEQILALEDESLGGKIEFSQGIAKFKCKLDRIDKLSDGSLLILDYKTGVYSAPKSLQSLTEMEMGRNSIKEGIKSFQLPLYLYFVKKKFQSQKINAAIYNLREVEIDYLLKDSQKQNGEEILEISLRALQFLLEEIFDPDKDFEADESQAHICERCSFFYLCR